MDGAVLLTESKMLPNSSMPMDSPSELLKALEYTDSENWIAADNATPSQARLLNLSVDKRILGAYTIQTSPDLIIFCPAFQWFM